MNWKLLEGDCLHVMHGMEENSIDSLVTDPPAGISFMNKSWDTDHGGRDHWIGRLRFTFEECLRVMKPGAHGLVWALPRTSHWTATALEDAGFEIRDVVTHLFGSGFPKSMNVSIAIDKQAGAMVARGKAFVTAGRGEREDIQDENGKAMPIHDPVTDAAKQWQGFGTALKPASEHWILIRKPLSEKTVAANLLKWGCGAINIDASRISTDDGKDRSSPPRTPNAILGGGKGTNLTASEHNIQGRFPSNLILSHSPHCEDDQCDIECAIKLLDEQSGTLKSGARTNSMASNTPNGNGVTHGRMERKANLDYVADSGGASRFFARFAYVPKASKSDKNAGLDKPSTHPTVKSTKLMSYLITMVTPPGGTVLDCFAGSGSTGVAALKSGFKFVGIEKEAEYAAIAKMRLIAAGEKCTD